MESKSLLLYSTVDGHTLKISQFLQKLIIENGQAIDLFSMEDFDGNLEKYDKIILGSSIRYGYHSKKMTDFINANKSKLDTLKTAFFSVNLVARKPEKNKPDTNPYVVKFFKTINWTPTIKEVFAGMLDYKKYSFFDRKMIQLIMWITKGPTDTNTKIEYTDWNKVKAFGERVIEL